MIVPTDFNTQMIYMYFNDLMAKQYIALRTLEGIILNSIYIPNSMMPHEGIYINWGSKAHSFGVVEITCRSCKTCTILMTPQKFMELLPDWKTKPVFDFESFVHKLFAENRNKEESYFTARPLIQ